MIKLQRTLATALTLIMLGGGCIRPPAQPAASPPSSPRPPVQRTEARLPAVAVPGGLRAFSLKAAGLQLHTAQPAAEARALGGITRVAGLVYDAPAQEIILVGESEPGLPTITLDDFVVALRALYLEHVWPLVSIDPAPETASTGRQAVRLEGGIANSAFGADLLAADVTLKKLALGLVTSGVSDVPSYFSLSLERARQQGAESHVSSRFWFRPRGVSLAVRDGVFVIREAGIGVVAETLSNVEDGAPTADGIATDKPAEVFADALTQRFDGMRGQRTELQRLKSLFDLVAVARGLQLLPSQPDLSFWLDEFKLTNVPTPADYPVLRQAASFDSAGAPWTLEVAGGIEVQALVARLQDGDVTALRDVVLKSRPAGQPVVWPIPMSSSWGVATHPAPSEAAAASAGAGASPEAEGAYVQRTIRPGSSEVGAPIIQRPAQPLVSAPATVPLSFGASNGPGAAHLDLGGVDFSSVQLRYLSEAPEGATRKLGYVFKADVAQPAIKPIDAGRSAQLAADSFFVQLAVDPARIWVNLHPAEPDRVVDQVLMNDVGRVLLQSDLAMKLTVAELLHDDTPTGKAFWDALEAYADAHPGTEICLAFRQWIVPGPVEIYTTGDTVYVARAEMDVKLEAQQVVQQSERAQCSPDVLAYAEGLYRQLLLPEVVKRVNSGAEYHELQTVFLSRVLAEWYRQHYAKKSGMFNGIVGSGNVAAWPSRVAWDPAQIWRAYVNSYQNGEVRVTREKRLTRGSQTLVQTNVYVYGGVDFQQVGLTPIAYSELQAQHPEVRQEIGDALLFGVGGQGSPDARWLGVLQHMPAAVPVPGR